MSVIDMIKTSLKYDEDMLRKITKLRVNSQERKEVLLHQKKRRKQTDLCETG